MANSTHCYKLGNEVVNNYKPFDEAQAECKRAGGSLIQINNELENQELTKYFIGLRVNFLLLDTKYKGSQKGQLAALNRLNFN